MLHRLPPLNVDSALAAADTLGAPTGHRIGCQRQLPLDLLAQGGQDDHVPGMRTYRLAIESAGAAMLSVQFSTFRPAPGAMLYLYDQSRTTFLGGFGTANETASGLFATGLLPGPVVVLEYQEPLEGSRGVVQVGGVLHAWQGLNDLGAERDIGPQYPIDPCHINVSCPAGAPWQAQARSTLALLRPDGGICNGTLLNNTLNNGTPYVLMANHCRTPNEAQWVFYFNYQAATCEGTTGNSGQSILGATLRAGSYYGDFCLLELTAPPPPSFNAYYSGWDRTDNAPQSGATLLTPAGHPNKIALYNAPATSTTETEIGAACWKTLWTQGCTGGGSGAPLFDQHKRLAGHLVEMPPDGSVGGVSVKFNYNWDGTSPNVRLRDWLDPANSQPLVLDGYDPGAVNTDVEVRAKVLLQGPYDVSAGGMATGLRDAGLLPATEPYTAGGYLHQGGGGGEAMLPAAANAMGNGRIVDWVVLELRNAGNASQVVATRSVLLRRDGRISDMDGTSNVRFSNRPPGNYYLAVRHRNHLGIMTDAAVALGTSAQMIDLSNGSVALRGGAEATLALGNKRLMWCGDVNGNGTVKYTGNNNDRDPILVRIGGVMPTAVYNGYAPEDVNLDGMVKYTGVSNDRDMLLQVIGANSTAVRQAQLP